MNFFDQLKTEVESTRNSNFYFDKLSWPSRIWIKSLCRLIELRLKRLDNKIDTNFRLQSEAFQHKLDQINQRILK